MKTALFKKPVRLITENGKIAGVILDLKDFEELLERLEDADGLKALADMKKKPPRFRNWEDVRAEIEPRIRSSSSARPKKTSAALVKKG